ncbi:MAG: tRNA pseudouridine(38-40) synthase TruA [Rhodocyclaceae bacterium]|nr:tRNA pseudouridine(38-40) synthase TruA [Rhodocyclaceae bacterium]
MRFALGVEYDGSAYAGWQLQKDVPTVQGALEAALAGVAGRPVRATCAGRTDAGVHATGQVVHFDPGVVRPDSAWVRGVNAHLPPDVAVLWATPVADDFHARFCAVGRRYRYLLLNDPVRPALADRRVGWHHRSLDAEVMDAAAATLVGEHDFSAFRAAECQAKSPVKHLRRAAVTRRGAFLVFEFEANAFLHHMVRNIVGALVQIGNGRRPPGWIAELLASRDRTQAAPTFAAAGLYLTGVAYPSHWRLPSTDRMILPF